jgi:hypothetical protein
VAPGLELYGTPAGPRRERIRRILAAERAPDEIAKLRVEIEALRDLVQGATGRRDGDSDDAANPGIGDTDGEETTQRG